MVASITRRGAVAAAVAALALGASACGSDNGGGGGGGGGSNSGSSGGSQGGKIALLLPENKTTRYEQQDKPNFEKRVQEKCPSCQVIYENAEQDPAKQQQQAESAITNGAKVLVLDAVDVKAAAGIVARAKQSNIPVISYGRLVSDADLDYYVSIDPFKVGVQQGQALVDALKKEGKPQGPIIMINGSPTDSNSAPYKKGAHSVIDKAGVKIAKEYDTPDWSPDKAQSEMEQALTSVGKSNVAGVYVANDGMATGVVAALKSASVDPSSLPITGQDAEVSALQRIVAGQQLMTVYQPIRKIAFDSADIAVALVQGKQPPPIATAKVNNGKKDVPSVLVPTEVITKDNIKGTVVKDGFVTPDQICTGPYKSACSKAGLQ